MQKNKLIITCILAIILTVFSSIFSLNLADESIIQEEKMSFETCIKVIDTTEEKLSVKPEIADVPGEKRIAVYTLSDGELTITCDRLKQILTVSTNTN